jgi:chromosome partitioning protein
MGQVISIVNNKGGVGKTTSTGIIAEILSCLGKKVLVVDLDQQGNLSMLLEKYIEDQEDVINGTASPSVPNIHELFKFRMKTKEDVESIVQKTSLTNLFIIPSSKRHKNTQLIISMNETGNNNIILRKAIRTIQNDYDYIIIDNPPANDILTVNSMFASDMILVPVRMEGFSYKGLLETLETMNYIITEHEISNLKFGGVFVTQAETNTNIYRDLRTNYIDGLKEKFLHTPIRKDIRVAEVETMFKPLLEYAPNTNAIFDYSKLIIELNILDEASSSNLRAAIGE